MAMNLRNRLKQKLDEFETPQQFLDFLNENGVELTDDELDEVCAGIGFDANIAARPFEIAFAEHAAGSGFSEDLAEVIAGILSRPKYEAALSMIFPII